MLGAKEARVGNLRHRHVSEPASVMLPTLARRLTRGSPLEAALCIGWELDQPCDSHSVARAA